MERNFRTVCRERSPQRSLSCQGALNSNGFATLLFLFSPGGEKFGLAPSGVTHHSTLETLTEVGRHRWAGRGHPSFNGFHLVP